MTPHTPLHVVMRLRTEIPMRYTLYPNPHRCMRLDIEDLQYASDIHSLTPSEVIHNRMIEVIRLDGSLAAREGACGKAGPL